MKSGIVFQVEGRKAVILQSDGSFMSVPAKNGWKPGELVALPSVPRRHIVLIRVCAACIAFLLVGGFGWRQLYLSPVAFISVDVNPSIELGVNRYNQVVSAAALNEEGAKILEEADSKNIAYQEALKHILSAEGTRGYLDADANVVLTVFSADEARQSALLAELQEIVASYAGQIAAECHAVDESTISGAHGHGVTAGKYLYLQQLQELAPETDISEYLHHSIEQIKGEIETCKQEHETEGCDNSHEKKHQDSCS